MRHIAIPLILALAACAPDDPGANEGLGNIAEAPEPHPSISPSEPPLYVGRWAARKDSCADGAWKFAEMDLSTAGEVSCDFHRVRDVPGGYDVDASCHAEGGKSDEVIKLRFAEAGGMRVESKTFRPIGLIRCGEAKP